MQGLNTTAAHGHAALFGVYGMLGIGLMLFCLRGLQPAAGWSDRLLKRVVLVPQHRPGDDGVPVAAAGRRCCRPGPASPTACGMRARAEFMHQPLMEALVWMRVPGDIVFSAGGAMLAWFAYRLWRGRPLSAQAVPVSRATKPAE